MKLSRLADYAVCILVAIEKHKKGRISAAEIAGFSGFPLPTVSKILKMLTKSGLVGSILGAGGGYFLQKKVDDISLQEIIEAIEGPVHLTSCIDEDCETCDYSGTCFTRGQWTGVNDAVKNALGAVKLVDMMEQ